MNADVRESTNNLSIAIEKTQPATTEYNYDHLTSEQREDLTKKDI